jgi:integrase
MRHKISKSAINRLKPGQSIADVNPVGLVARRLPSGVVTYGYRYRHKETGRQHWVGLGTNLAPEQARARALKVAGQAKNGEKPSSSAEDAAKWRKTLGRTVNDVLDDFIERYARPNSRSVDQIERAFAVDVRPKIGEKAITELRRLDIVELLDGIEDRGRPVAADRTLAYLRKALRWYATRDDSFVVPIVPGMARTKPKERARTRVLSDDEIRDLYVALDALGNAAPKCFPAFVKFLLLTAQRLRMVSNLPWSEIESDKWLVPRQRNKVGLDHLVPLTTTASALIAPSGKGYVFSSDGGKTPFSGFSKSKAALDRKLAEIRKTTGRKPMEHFTFHDLRRTARSLMSRAGVSSDHAERVLGHVIGGARAVYDRYQYADEKRDALEKLDALVERILHPDKAVIHFPKGRKKR